MNIQGYVKKLRIISAYKTGRVCADAGGAVILFSSMILIVAFLYNADWWIQLFMILLSLSIYVFYRSLVMAFFDMADAKIICAMNSNDLSDIKILTSDLEVSPSEVLARQKKFRPRVHEN